MLTLLANRLGAHKAFHVVLAVALMAWTLAPAVEHTPRVLETLQEHAEMVADHGHSHGLEEDLWWALHGHEHDVVDHDHNSVAMLRDVMPAHSVFSQSHQSEFVSNGGSKTRRPPERPPRV